MSFWVRALASGSSGNSTLAVSEQEGRKNAVLIDAGLSVRVLERSLAEAGILPSEVSGIVLTHEHDDHVRGAHAFARRYQVPLVANAATLRRVIQGKPDVPQLILPTGSRVDLSPLQIETFPVPHDAAEPVGVNIYGGPAEPRHKVSYLTDVGSVTDAIRRAIAGAQLLILEANHDTYRLHSGPYPEGIKKRILSDYGHLSNEEAVALMTEHLLANGPCTIWLAHLSKINNRPKLALNYAQATLRLATRCPFVLDVAQRDRPSALWSPGATALQLRLF